MIVNYENSLIILIQSNLNKSNILMHPLVSSSFFYHKQINLYLCNQYLKNICESNQYFQAVMNSGTALMGFLVADRLAPSLWVNCIAIM